MIAELEHQFAETHEFLETAVVERLSRSVRNPCAPRRAQIRYCARPFAVAAPALGAGVASTMWGTVAGVSAVGGVLCVVVGYLAGRASRRIGAFN
ncbi:hypothetical protein CJ178_31335 [Rhodococcus sp. ACPA4]|nr:hypothetical protein CJ178_31335 [Rhodococcus sp. ACPA4]